MGRGRVSQHPRVHVLLPCARLEPGCSEETHTGKSVPFPRACFCCCHFSLKCLFCLFLPSQVLKTLRMLRVSMPTSVPRVSRSPYHHACLVPSAVLNGFAHGQCEPEGRLTHLWFPPLASRTNRTPTELFSALKDSCATVINNKRRAIWRLGMGRAAPAAFVLIPKWHCVL